MMKLQLLISLVWVLTATEAFGGTNWFSPKAVYNRWHETELERWLSDHDVPYPSPADRKDLENQVKAHWNSKVQQPMGYAADSLADQAHHSREWIFDTWSDSHLKAFLDANGIPAPQPPRRDLLLKAARDNYDTIAKRLGETISYPGNWVYAQWSESDLKAWLEEHGWKVPEPTTRDRLIASVRRNSRLASLQTQSLASSASSSAQAAQSTLNDSMFTAWSDSQLKRFLDEHGVQVPQGSKRNELIALARKHRTSLLHSASSASDAAASTLGNAYGAATSRANNEYTKATDDVKFMGYDAFDKAVALWSDSRLKEYLDARGVPVPQGGRRDELLARVRANKYKAARNWTPWTFDTWDTEHLKNYLSSMGPSKAAQRADATREELSRQAQDVYARASKAGGTSYASATSKIAQATGAAKDTTFDRWSGSDLKSYLDSFGVPVYQGSTLNELRAAARRNSYYFKYGTTTPQSTFYAYIMNSLQWVMDQLKVGALIGQGKGHDAAEQTRQRANSLRSEFYEGIPFKCVS